MMAPRLISLASTKTSPKNMGHGQKVADWGDRRLSGTIVPTCDRPIGDGPGREANAELVVARVGHIDLSVQRRRAGFLLPGLAACPILKFWTAAPSPFWSSTA